MDARPYRELCDSTTRSSPAATRSAWSRGSPAGFDPAFGGVHDQDTTRMSVLGFLDGSYLELLGPTPDTDPAVPGPIAFLLGTEDLDAVGDAADLVPAADWHGRRFAWVAGFEGDLGVVEPEPGGDVSAGPAGR